MSKSILSGVFRPYKVVVNNKKLETFCVLGPGITKKSASVLYCDKLSAEEAASDLNAAVTYGWNLAAKDMYN